MKKRLHELEEAHQSKNTSRLVQSKTLATTTITENCPLCKGNHFLFKCQQFKSLRVNERRKVVSSNKLCFNCLKDKHFSKDCKSGSCKTCNSKHNTLLHINEQNHHNYQTNNSASISINSSHQIKRHTTILPTAIIMVRDKNNGLQPCRALIDSGAQSTLIAEACVQRLRLARMFDRTSFYGVGNDNPNYSRGKVQIEIFVPKINKTLTTPSYCLSNLTQFLPSHNIGNTDLEFFNNLELADPAFYRKNRIDIILGADLFPQCMLDGKIPHPTGSPTAINTVFGWIIMGNVVEPEHSTFIAHVYSDMDVQLQKFWEIEECQRRTKILSPEEEMAESHYANNVERLQNGKYMVRLPFKTNLIELGESKSQALKRLQSMERKFVKSQDLKTQYHGFMEEYENLQHMQIAQNDAKYYMPHHAVLKPSSTTTKLRVVFDASCKGSNNLSLNDYLLIGPIVQNDLYTILLRFRKYEVGFTADIEKMYRQVIMHPADRAYQTILWRRTPEEKPNEYQLTTVTYGTAAAPFLATRTLKQVALDNLEEYPQESDEIINNFYVDDYMSSLPDLTSANNLRSLLCALLSKAGFNLRKWSSNSPQFLETINTIDKSPTPDTIINCSETVKTLGLLWNTTFDSFQYSLSFSESSDQLTKRSILSEISKIYDPIGWLAPVVIAFKLYMQKLWLKGITWDQKVTTDLSTEWVRLRKNLHHIKDLKIPRWIQFTEGDQAELHGFSDASELAYAAAIYVRIIKKNGSISTFLLSSKTRVAPIKQITLPRLELCAAHLMVKLMLKIKDALYFGNVVTYGWTDSTVVLSWISNHPRRWKTFIANRTSYIIEHLPSTQWHHIASKHNPADLATRGILIRDLINNSLWWKGPQILQNQDLEFPTVPQVPKNINLEEKKNMISTIATCITNDFNLAERYSEFAKLCRITALLLRFIYNCKLKLSKDKRKKGIINTKELEEARKSLIKTSQQRCYENEIHLLASGKTLPTTNKLLALTPFLDREGLLRVGGRLENANISYDQKHPYILHKNDSLTKLIVKDYHIKYLHAGVRQLQYLLGLQYWIPHVTYLIKRTVYKCIVCMRYRQLPYQQRMSDLPSHRVTPDSTFLYVGIDFAGPIFIRSWKGRGSKSYKCWIAVFVCLNTKAIHLEAVTELTTEAFLASLRRFISRRGKPIHIYTDNGTNFIGCDRKLKELSEFLQTKYATIYQELANQKIQWHFSPPSAPHFGGIWEAGVKSMKFHLMRVLGSSSATYEEITTLLCQIECCLNSRPLTLKFEGDPDPLTPGHFLILRPLTTLPDENLINVNANHLTRWQYMQQLVGQFWSKWSNEYLSQLQKRPKWMTKLQNLQRDDVVLIKDESLPPAHWLIGRVIETHPGKDGLVRVVTIKTKRGELKRPIAKLCPLFIDC